jgi:hypothetical protein
MVRDVLVVRRRKNHSRYGIREKRGARCSSGIVIVRRVLCSGF